MDIPNEIRAAVEEESAKFEHQLLMAASQNLSKNYREDSCSKTITKEEEIAAYAVSRMPATYSAVSNALQKTYALLPNPPKNIIDIGAGTGAASLAAINLFDGVDSVLCLEKEQEMLNFGQKLFEKLGIKNSTWQRFSISKQEIENTADLVLISYVLNEIKDAEIEAILEKLWNATNEILLIIEPGTPSDFARMLKIREILLSKGAFLLAPCPHGKTCPISGDDWCHFSTRLSRSKLQILAKKGEMPYEDEKFTYLAFSKTATRKAAGRVLRQPIINPKCVSLKLCTEAGIQEKIITKSMPQYKSARKVKAGDEF